MFATIRTVEQLSLIETKAAEKIRISPTVPIRGEIWRLLNKEGFTRGEIARMLNARGVPTLSGRGIWHPGTVQRAADPVKWRLYMRRYRETHERTDYGAGRRARQG